MFCPFTIIASVINQIKLESGVYASAGEDSDKYTRKALLRQYIASTNGLIDGKDRMDSGRTGGRTAMQFDTAGRNIE